MRAPQTMGGTICPIFGEVKGWLLLIASLLAKHPWDYPFIDMPVRENGICLSLVMEPASLNDPGLEGPAIGNVWSLIEVGRDITAVEMVGIVDFSPLSALGRA